MGAITLASRALASAEVLPDASSLARRAAERIVTRLAEPGRRHAVALAGGSTPEALYRLLATDAFRHRIPWSDVHWFWGDERFVAADDALNNARAALDALLTHVPVPAENIHRIPTDVATPAESAARYEATLRDFHGGQARDPGSPLFSLVLMGLGPDGHTASLFPGDPVVDETHRWVVPVEKAGLAPFVPRVTLTLSALGSTREMLFLVSGAGKQAPLRRIRAGEHLPAARAHADGELVWLLDRGAAG